GIRDMLVTGVQTCALPILTAWGGNQPAKQKHYDFVVIRCEARRPRADDDEVVVLLLRGLIPAPGGHDRLDAGARELLVPVDEHRSEERRVGDVRRTPCPRC